MTETSKVVGVMAAFARRIKVGKPDPQNPFVVEVTPEERQRVIEAMKERRAEAAVEAREKRETSARETAQRIAKLETLLKNVSEKLSSPGEKVVTALTEAVAAKREAPPVVSKVNGTPMTDSSWTPLRKTWVPKGLVPVAFAERRAELHEARRTEAAKSVDVLTAYLRHRRGDLASAEAADLFREEGMPFPGRAYVQCRVDAGVPARKPLVKGHLLRERMDELRKDFKAFLRGSPLPVPQIVDRLGPKKAKEERAAPAPEPQEKSAYDDEDIAVGSLWRSNETVDGRKTRILEITNIVSDREVRVLILGGKRRNQHMEVTTLKRQWAKIN